MMVVNYVLVADILDHNWCAPE